MKTRLVSHVASSMLHILHHLIMGAYEKCSFKIGFVNYFNFWQDHEHAYFDSVDWALRKVFSGLKHLFIIMLLRILIWPDIFGFCIR